MKQLGYRFSLDDFGAGFSSFTYLKHMPVDQVKIDGSFIRYLDTNRADQIFVRAIVQVTRNSASRPLPSASKRRARWRCCSTWAWTTCRATTSASPDRSWSRRNSSAPGASTGG